MLFRCPHDLAELEPVPGGVACALGHHFDRAREGYLNLLVGGRKAPTRPPGDTGDMLRARRHFLDAGNYRPVLDAVVTQIVAAVGDGEADVLDAGCGEGWYLGGVRAALPRVRGWGIDVAKDGVRLAARRYPQAGFAVASSHRLPVADGTVDVVLSVFAPRPYAEFARVLSAEGVAVVVSPGPDHLAGLTEALYGEHRPHSPRAHADAEAGAALGRVRVRFELALEGDDTVAALLAMTPYWWRTTPAQRATVLDRGRLTTVVDVVVSTLGRPGLDARLPA